MTIEEALIIENKKDSRIRYITYHPGYKMFHFWSYKPTLNNTTNYDGVRGSYDYKENEECITRYKYDLQSNSFYIVCIDDIKNIK